MSCVVLLPLRHDITHDPAIEIFFRLRPDGKERAYDWPVLLSINNFFDPFVNKYANSLLEGADINLPAGINTRIAVEIYRAKISTAQRGIAGIHCR